MHVRLTGAAASGDTSCQMPMPCTGGHGIAPAVAASFPPLRHMHAGVFSPAR